MVNVNSLINNLPYVMQNSYGAAATIVVANALFAEVALRITTFVYQTLERRVDLDGYLRDEVQVGMIITSIISSTAVLSIALNKLIKFPFNPWAVAGLSTLSSVSYLTVRFVKE